MTSLPNADVRPVQCAGTCGRTLDVAWSSSCVKADGTNWPVWCGTCWLARMEER